MKMKIVAVGQDPYWLAAVQKASQLWSGETATLKCIDDLVNCIGGLAAPQINTLLLVDASGQGNMEQIVTSLREKGWKYVIVVAADPSAKEATAVLRRNLGYDYWEKTYEEQEIRKRLKACFDEITLQLPPLSTRHDPSRE